MGPGDRHGGAALFPQDRRPVPGAGSFIVAGYMGGNMPRKALILLAAAAVLGAAGCKSSTGPADESDFVGTWDATKAELVSIADSNTKADIITQGSTFTLVSPPAPSS